MISPILIAVEDTLNQRLLLESEKKQGYFYKFDTRELLKANIVDMIKVYIDGVNGGIYTLNEARAMLDLEPVEYGNTIRINQAYNIIDEQGNITSLNKQEEQPTNDVTKDVDKEEQETV